MGLDEFQIISTKTNFYEKYYTTPSYFDTKRLTCCFYKTIFLNSLHYIKPSIFNSKKVGLIIIMFFNKLYYRVCQLSYYIIYKVNPFNPNY